MPIGEVYLGAVRPRFSKDGFIKTYSDKGESEAGLIEVQVKATDHIERYKRKNGFYFDIEKRDLEAWYNDFIPFLFVLYDAQNDEAYYIEIGEYLRDEELSLEKINKFVRVYISSDNKFEPLAVLKLRADKNKMI